MSGSSGASAASHADPYGRLVEAMRTAVRRATEVGYMAVQEAATMAQHFAAMTDLDEAGELLLWVVCSMPARPFVESGSVGEELFAIGRSNGAS